VSRPVLCARTGWMDRAACAGTAAPETFFTEEIVPVAKTICRRCPVRGDCLAHALADDSLVGVWGGTTPDERRALRGDLHPPVTGWSARWHRSRGEATCRECRAAENARRKEQRRRAS
jgi:WhiB family redox-sensing transcriptional regulator